MANVEVKVRNHALPSTFKGGMDRSEKTPVLNSVYIGATSLAQ